MLFHTIFTLSLSILTGMSSLALSLPVDRQGPEAFIPRPDDRPNEEVANLITAIASMTVSMLMVIMMVMMMVIMTVTIGMMMMIII